MRKALIKALKGLIKLKWLGLINVIKELLQLGLTKCVRCP